MRLRMTERCEAAQQSVVSTDRYIIDRQIRRSRFHYFVPTQYAIYLQLLGGIWIIQTLPTVILGAYTRWFNDWALFVGWVVGIAVGTGMAVAVNLTPTYPLQIAGFTFPGYTA